MSGPAGGSTIQTFGSDQARRRLLRLIDTEAPVEVDDLTISAIPAGDPAGEHGAIATLTRPNFTFVISRN